jgi:aspartyl-tRNA(Asn)/glutamyl-tRNA(Gln) amidotransferase subunit C
MAFTPEDVQRLAKLARIELNTEQVSATLGHLDNIFGMIADMRQVNTEGIAPMAHACNVAQRLRTDAVTEGSLEQRDRCLALAPEAEAGLFLVPKVIE